MTYAASEGILGGNHTSRRAIYQFGISLPASPTGIVDGGIGKTVAKGQRTFLPPTEFVSQSGEERVIDGVRFCFQMASGTEAPAEFTFLLPDLRVLCMAEVCTQTQHNILTPVVPKCAMRCCGREPLTTLSRCSAIMPMS